MIGNVMHMVRKIRPWMIAVVMAAGGAWAGSCDESGDGCGPPDERRCTTDEECLARNGPGSFCPTGTTLLPDECGNLVEWGPVCSAADAFDADANADEVAGDVQHDEMSSDGEASGTEHADCEPADAYGPPTCVTDDDCVSGMGVGWTCTGWMVRYDSCGHYLGEVSYCEPPAGADAGDASTMTDSG